MIGPRSRTIWLLAGGAPLALVLGAAAPGLWTMGLAWIVAVIALAGADALLTARRVRFDVDAPGALEVGAAGVLLVLQEAGEDVGRVAVLLGLVVREREVLAHVLQGKLNKQIAYDLGINERTVKLHRTSFMSKLQVESVTELTGLVHEAGLFQNGELVL